MEYNSKKVEKHFFRGTATIYWWDGYNWRIQSKHKSLIKTLYKHLYKKPYKAVVEKEWFVFSVKNSEFSKIYKLMDQAYKLVLVQIGEVA